MFKITAKTQSGTHLNQAEFITEDQCNAWVLENNLVGDEIILTIIPINKERELQNQEAQSFLDSTDWKVIRHRDQQELGIATSMTAEEFQDLLQQRQMARNAIVR